MLGYRIVKVTKWTIAHKMILTRRPSLYIITLKNNYSKTHLGAIVRQLILKLIKSHPS